MRKKTNEELISSLYEAGPESDRGRKIIGEIIEQNTGLVKSIAKGYMSSGRVFDDLAQVGYIGLLSAIENYDPDKDAKFTTYASYMIKGEIRHYIRDRGSQIRLPAWIQELNLKVKKVEDFYLTAEGRMPTTEELVTETNLKEKNIKLGTKTRKLRYCKPLYAGKDTEQGDFINLETFIDEENSRGLPLEIEVRIREAIGKLSQVQQEVIKGIFYEGKTQAELGKKLGYSQRHISRLKDQALQKIEKKLE